jgi:hypothetical protein
MVGPFVEEMTDEVVIAGHNGIMKSTTPVLALYIDVDVAIDQKLSDSRQLIKRRDHQRRVT